MRRPWSGRHFRFLLAGVIFTALGFGCSNPKTITINVLGEDSSNLQAMKALAPAFEKEMRESGRTVSVSFEPASFEDARERADQDFHSGGGKYDIVLQYNFSLAEYASQNYVFKVRELLPIVPEGLPKRIEDSLFQNVWREVGFYYSNEVNPGAGFEAVGYPFAANTMVLVYNKSFFEAPDQKERFMRRYKRELRVPSTWEEFRDVGAFLNDPSKGQCGVALQGKDGGWLYYEWVNILNGFGGSVMKKDYGWQGGPSTPLEISTPVAEQAASFYASLKPYTCGDFFSMDAPAQRELMLGGKVAMGIMWSDYLFDLTERAAKQGLKFGFAPVPGSKSLIGGGSYYINRKSSNPDVAAQFVMFLLRRENQLELTRKGLCSPVRSVYSDPSVQSVPYLQALGESLSRATYMLEAGPDSDLISSGLTVALQRIWKGESPGPVLRETQNKLQQDRAVLFSKRVAGR